IDMKILTIFGLTMVIFACQTLAAEEDLEDDEEVDCPPDNNEDNGNNTPGRVSDKLCPDFQHLRSLMDQEKLQKLIQVHYNCDGKFRKAMRYYNTTGFEQVTQQLSDTDAYQTILREFENASVYTVDIESVAAIFYCIILPVQFPDNDCDCKSIRGHTFVNDVLDLMPQIEVHNYIAASQANGTNFGNFTKAVTSKEFQATLKANINKKDVIKPLRTLRRKGWDIPELLKGMQTIFTW
ncbi:hypothetical protein KR026_011979, partial [Drosophila bipectinata]